MLKDDSENTAPEILTTDELELVSGGDYNHGKMDYNRGKMDYNHGQMSVADKATPKFGSETPIVIGF